MQILKDLSLYSTLSESEKLSTYLDERSANTIPSRMSTEVLVDMRTLPFVEHVMFHPEIPNYYVRETLGKKLISIGMKFKERGYTLFIQELYRDFAIQQAHFTEIQEEIYKKSPTLTPEELWEQTTQFIADPALTPPHCTGGAVDLTIVVSKTLEQLDMGTSMNTIHTDSYLISDNITPQQKENRTLLLRAMLDEGLAPLASEWWHYTYGEKYWAAFYGEKYALYDVITPA